MKMLFENHTFSTSRCMDFVDVTDAGGKLAIMWDKTVASVPFKIGM